MKKMFLAGLLFTFAMATQVNAQSNKEIGIESFQWGATSASGAQTITVPGGKGTVKFDKTGDRFTNVVYTDASGKQFRLAPVRPGTAGAPPPTCKTPLPDACFGTANKNVYMCICKPTDFAGNSGGEYSIAILVPAINKVREAAAKGRSK
jgi:hypothetical protein